MQRLLKVLLAIVPILFCVGILIQYYLLSETLFWPIFGLHVFVFGLIIIIVMVYCCMKKKSSSLLNLNQHDVQSLNSYRSARSRLSFKQNSENIELGSLNDSVIEISRASGSSSRKRMRQITPTPESIPVPDDVELGPSTSSNVNENQLNQIDSLKHQVHELQTQLNEAQARLKLLSRHSVYGLCTTDKEMFYAGQAVNVDKRIFVDHLPIACGKVDQSKTQPVHTKIKAELKNGIYAVELFSGLDELRRNEIELCIILKLKELKQAANVNDGIWTERFAKLDDNERKKEIDDVYASAMATVQKVSVSELITLDNVDEKMKSRCETKKCSRCQKEFKGPGSKCSICVFVKQEDVECKREGCDKKGVGQYGYCWNCYSHNTSDIFAEKTLPALQVKYANGANAKKNGLQRALVLAMCHKLKTGYYLKPKLESMLPGVKVVAGNTIDSWINKIKAIEEDKDPLKALATYLKADEKIYVGLTSEAIDKILEYEYSIDTSAAKASKRLTELFKCSEDNDKFALTIVQQKFETIKKSLLKRSAPEEKPTVERKIPKIN